MMDLAQIIRNIYPVSDEGLNKISACVHTLHVKRGELIITQGKKCENLFLIRKGLVRSYCDDDGKEDTRWFAIEGDALASIHSLYRGEPAMSSVEALIPTDLYYISKSDVEELLNYSKELVYWGYMLAIEELYALERRYTYIGTGDAFTRYKSFMKMRSRETIRQIPLKHIASYLKITPQTLSKIRSKYIKE